MFTIYTFGDLHLFGDGLRAIAMLFDPLNTNLWVSGSGAFGIGKLAVVALMFSLAIVAIKGIYEQTVHVDHILVLLILFSVMFVPKTRLQIEDVMTGQVTAIDDVPLIIGAVGGIVSQAAYEIAMTFETVFQVPSGGGGGDWVSGWQGLGLGTGSSAGLNSPLRILLGVRNIMPDQAGGEIMTNMVHYVRNCTKSGFSTTDWKASAEKTYYLLDHPGNQLTYLYDGATSGISAGVPCAEAAVVIKAQMDSYFSTSGGGGARFTDQLCQQVDSRPDYSGGAMTSCDADQYVLAYEQMMPALQTAGIEAASFMADLMFSQLTNSTMHCGEYANETDFRNCVSTMVSANEQTRVQNAAAGTGFAKIMLTAMNLFLFLFYTLTPVISIVMLAAGLTGIGIAGKFLLFGVWAHSWLPVAVVIDFFIESSVRQELHNYTISILMGNLDGTRFYDIIADHISMGADLLAATPLVTLAILTGSMFSLTSMASRISGKDHVDEKIAAPSVVSNGPLAELSYDKINTPQAQTKAIATGQGAVAFASPDAISTQSTLSSQAMNNAATERANRISGTINERSTVALSDGMESTMSTIERVQNGHRLTSSQQAAYDNLARAGYGVLDKFTSSEGIDDNVAAMTGAALAAGVGAHADGKGGRSGRNAGAVNSAITKAASMVGAKLGWDARRTAELRSALKESAGLTEEGEFKSGSDASFRDQQAASSALESVKTLDADAGEKLTQSARLGQEASMVSDTSSQKATISRAMQQFGTGQQMGVISSLISKMRTDGSYASRLDDPQMGIDRYIANAASEANANGANGGAIISTYRDEYARQLAYFAKDKNLTSTHPQAASAAAKLQAMANTMSTVPNTNGESSFVAGGVLNWLSDTQSHFSAPQPDRAFDKGVDDNLARIGAQTPDYQQLRDTGSRIRTDTGRDIATTRDGMSQPNQSAYDQSRQDLAGEYSQRRHNLRQQYDADPRAGGVSDRIGQSKADMRSRGDVESIGDAARITGGVDQGAAYVTLASQAIRDFGSEVMSLASGQPTTAFEQRAANLANQGLSQAANDPQLSRLLGNDPEAWKYYGANYASEHKESLWSPDPEVMSRMEGRLGPERAAQIQQAATERASGYGTTSVQQKARDMTSNEGSSGVGVPPGVGLATPNDMDALQGDIPASTAPGNSMSARAGAMLNVSSGRQSMVDTIYAAAVANNVDPLLALSVAKAESAFNPNVTSRAGAEGLMQLMPGTAARYGVTDSFDPEQNADGGTKYLNFLIDKFDGNLDLVLAGYNAGEGAVAKHGNEVPPYAETQDYVRKVTANYERLKAELGGTTGGGY